MENNAKEIERLIGRWGYIGVNISSERGECMAMDIFGCPCNSVVKWHVSVMYLPRNSMKERVKTGNVFKKKRKRFKAEGKTLLKALKELQSKLEKWNGTNS